MAAVDQQIINTQLNAKIDIQNTAINDFKDEMKIFIGEMRDFKQEMRDRDNRRAAEIAEMNAKIDSKIDKLSTQIQNIAIVAVVGVGAIVWAVVSVVKS